VPGHADAVTASAPLTANWLWALSRGVGYMDVMEALLPYRNISAHFRFREKYFILKILTNLRTNIIKSKKKSKSYPRKRLWRPIGL
jgi:hypothetical protein